MASVAMCIRFVKSIVLRSRRWQQGKDIQSSQVKTLFFDRADCNVEAENWKVDSVGVTENRFARLSIT